MLNSLNALSTNQQNLAWKLVAKYTLAVQQSIRSELGTQDRIPNIWKECMKNILLKSMTKAAEKYFRKRLRRQQRNMPALPAIVISDDSDDDVEILNWRSWCLPSLSRCPFDSGFLLIFTHFLFGFTKLALQITENFAPRCHYGHTGRKTWNEMKWNDWDMAILNGYPAWWTNKKLWNMAIEIVDFPMKNGDFPLLC